jgi:predicted esterase
VKTVLLDFVHRFIPATTPGLPVLLLLHGTGGNEDDLIGMGESLLPGAALLSPRGKAMENGMPRFFRRLAEGVLDVDDLKARSFELAEFVEQAVETHGIPATPIIAVGYSNGANIASGLLLARPDTLAGVCLLRPMVPYIPDPKPNLRNKQIFISAGEHDSTMLPGESNRLADLYRSYGAAVTLKYQPTDHGLISADIADTAAWIETMFLA